MADLQGPQPRRTRSRALVLLILGILLLTPPFATIFHFETKVLDIPVTLIFLFAVWALLILGAFLLARTLQSVGAEANTDDIVTQDLSTEGGDQP